jgi:phospholipase/carboxylesterase
MEGTRLGAVGSLSRRDFVMATLLAACGGRAAGANQSTPRAAASNPSKARLASRPRRPSREIGLGLTELKLTAGPRDGLIYLPAGYRGDRPAPFALMLHGAGGSARDVVANSGPLSDATNTVILGVDSRGLTWDVLSGRYGPDIAFIDQALDWAFARCAVDPARLAIGGFSDGASYGLSVGLANGDLFTHVLAFSPGFMVPPAVAGKPRIFISHGTQDQVLQIDSTSRSIVPQLKRAGYEVRYREFAGPHTVPQDVAQEALEWFTGAKPG